MNIGKKETSKLRGFVKITARDKFGNIKQKVETPNIIVNAGLISASELLIGAGTAFQAIAIGTGGASTFDTTSTSLFTETDRNASTTTTETGYISRFVSLFTGTQSTAVNESGVLDNASSAGDMLCATSFSVVNIESDDTIQVTWDITHS